MRGFSASLDEVKQWRRIFLKFVSKKCRGTGNHGCLLHISKPIFAVTSRTKKWSRICSTSLRNCLHWRTLKGLSCSFCLKMLFLVYCMTTNSFGWFLENIVPSTSHQKISCPLFTRWHHHRSFTSVFFVLQYADKTLSSEIREMWHLIA